MTHISRETHEQELAALDARHDADMRALTTKIMRIREAFDALFQVADPERELVKGCSCLWCRLNDAIAEVEK